MILESWKFLKIQTETKYNVKKDLDLVRKVLGPTTNAPARLTQLAAALTGDSPVEGIIPKFHQITLKRYGNEFTFY